MNTKRFSNTDVQHVKQQNAQSGLSYNKVKQLLAEKYMKTKK
ncbi:hypothetical protein [Bacillus sp. HMF5848]|nr:hypothetical protein [Bacillus sp. HMF5848]